MKTEYELSHEYLLSLLDYNPETGRFIWKNSRRPGHNGKVAGNIGPGGNFNYATIGIRFKGKDRNYGISRLAWFYVHGEWPNGQLRFSNGDPSDARISNLVEYVAKKRYKMGKPSSNTALPEYKNKPNKVSSRRGGLKYRFGITPEQYVEMLTEQKGVCALCEQPETVILHGNVKQLCVDHDHKTGKVRALLCGGCNSGLGHFKDDSEVMIRAAAYIRKHSGKDDNIVPFKLKAVGDES